MIHSRDFEGGHLASHGAFPDGGGVDMPASIRARERPGFDGPLRPDHVSLSAVDPGRERSFPSALGRTRGPLQAADAA